MAALNIGDRGCGRYARDHGWRIGFLRKSCARPGAGYTRLCVFGLDDWSGSIVATLFEQYSIADLKSD